MPRMLMILLICSLALPARAATLRVERDGSVDYTTIQDAVDAAASGDTIFIGPGRYDEGRIVTTAGWSEKVRVLVHQTELTLIGTGPDQTIIGPSSPYDSASQGDDRGIVAGPYFNSYRVRVSGIGFENMWGGVVGTSAPCYHVDNCRFIGNVFGVVCSGATDLFVWNCKFSMLGFGSGNLLNTNSMNNVEVWNCDFTLSENDAGYQVNVQFNTTLDVNIHDCRFYEGKYGLRFSGTWGSVAQIWNCRFVGQSVRGLDIIGLSAIVNDCMFEQQNSAIMTSGSNTDLAIHNTSIQDAASWSFQINSVGSLKVNDSVLAHGPVYTVYQPYFCDKNSTFGYPLLDMTNNDWGTTDADTIASWIHLCYYDVDFIPYIGQPVPTESIGWGSLKAQFR